MSRSILHMLTPLKHMSPFDVSMAVDAGFDALVPYTGVTLDEVAGLVQDAIFSRSPNDAARTSVFIAGKSAELALDMMEAAKGAFVGPFQLNLFADPAGSFTTGAALVAVVKKTLRDKLATDLKDKRVAIFGGTGVVAFCAAVLCAQEGARPMLLGRDGAARVAAAATTMRDRFGAEVEVADGGSDEAKRAAVREAEVILSCAAAGVNVLARDHLAAAERLLIAADINAVPPTGVEGVGVHDDAKPLEGSRALGIGALTVGSVKYQTESGLFRRLLATETPVSYDFRDAYRLALDIAG
jgi:methylene-tetrahydromethanopterin dehydrogenase